ncbi:MAG TPA: chemotaxis protein CheB [Candidatus Dormibacteraeota bacterium]|nr:chemotaxis protein CheB [Candidatus Dormibacteraeota bacterium]
MRRDLVVIGGSAGALEPLKQIVSDLPPDLPAAVLVVIHLAATSKSALAPILNRVGGMQAVIPRDGDPIRPGYVYVATPDHHLEVQDGVIRLTKGPRINGVRPAVDVLFRTAARHYGSRVAGVVLSGGLDDGSAGLMAIRAAGGMGIVQSPEDAVVESMPKNAIKVAEPEHVAPADEIGRLIAGAVREPVGAGGTMDKGGVEMEPVGVKDTPGQVTGITCPDCHGSIWLQTGEGGEVAFTCRVGHSYSPESFFEIQAENVENAVWAAVRSLEEQAALAGVMGSQATRFGDADGAKRFELRQQMADANASTIRTVLLDRSEA